MAAAPRIELVPSPLPLGTAEKMVSESPPPSVSSQFANEAFGSDGTIPARTKADSANADHRVGSLRWARSAMVRISRV